MTAVPINYMYTVCSASFPVLPTQAFTLQPCESRNGKDWETEAIHCVFIILSGLDSVQLHAAYSGTVLQASILIIAEMINF